jgi:hypothetical protein
VTLRQTGDNTLAIVEALDRRDVSGRQTAATYFDVANRSGLVYGPTTGRVVAGAAVVLAVFAWVRLLSHARRLQALGRLGFTAAWIVGGFAVAVAAMVAATWALRMARETFHPWYARPDRLFVLLVTVAAASGWLLTRIAARLPRRVRGSKNPGFIWFAVLPFWIALAVLMEWKAPSAAHLWTLPLLTAGIVLSGLPASVPLALRTGSVIVLGVTGTLWIPLGVTLLRFVVATFGRLPIVTPVYVYPALLALCGVMLGPPLVSAAVTPERRVRRPSIVSGLVLLALAVTGAMAYFAPAYDYAHPARRQVQFVQDVARGRSYWVIGGLEPGVDVLHGADAPNDWHPAPASLDTFVPVPSVAAPFRFVATGAPVDVPGAFSARLRYGEGRTELEITARADPPASVWFVMPPGLTPLTPNLPGRLRGTRWVAQYSAPPPEGVAFRATIPPQDSPRLTEGAVVLWTSRLPGGVGWQGLTGWLPQDTSVWTARAAFIQPLGPLLAIETAASPAPPIR